MSFLECYNAYAKKETDAPHVFHKVMAYGVLGAAVGNRWRYRYFGGRWLTPHLWILLLAESSTYHKTEAIRVARRVLNVMSERFYDWDGSHRALREQFAEHDEGVMFAFEFEQFLGVMSQNYTAGARGLFTDLYDGELAGSIYKNTGKQHWKEGLAVSFLAACTPAQLTDWLKERDVAAGLLPRFIIVHATEQEEQFALPRWHADELDAELRDLQNSIRMYANTPGMAMTISPGAQQIYEAWFKRMTHVPLDGTRADPWKSRLATVCIKLAMLNQINRDLKGKIGEASMRDAIELTDELLGHIKQVCQEELALSPFEEHSKRLRYLLRKYGASRHDGWVDWSFLMNHMRLDRMVFRKVVETLAESKQIDYKTTRPQRLRLAVREPGEDDQ